MASPGTAPSARVYPFVASAGDVTYLWGGRGDAEPKAIFIYRHDTETWMRRLTSGPHPSAGLSGGGCAMWGHNLYIYGGFDNKNCNCENFHELNTQTWQWRKLYDGRAGGPGKKRGCRMISHQDKLLVVGGAYDKMPSSRQAGARYEKDTVIKYFFTNEVHGYNLTSGKCRRVLVKQTTHPQLEFTNDDK